MNSVVQLSKQRLSKQFGKAAKRYNDAAQVQLDIAFDLVQRLPRNLGSCADLGCGTGRMTERLRLNSTSLLGIDLSIGMLQVAKQQYADVCWVAGDAEEIPLQDNSLDTLVSSMALQWCNPIDNAMSEVFRVLTKPGCAHLALLCDGALFELSSSWAKVDDVPRVNHFEPPKALRKAAQQAGFEVKLTLKDYVTWHSDVRSVLNSIRHIGASHVPETGNKAPLSRRMLVQLQNAYAEQYAQKGKLPLTYKVAFLELTP